MGGSTHQLGTGALPWHSYRAYCNKTRCKTRHFHRRTYRLDTATFHKIPWRSWWSASFRLVTTIRALGHTHTTLVGDVGDQLLALDF